MVTKDPKKNPKISSKISSKQTLTLNQSDQNSPKSPKNDDSNSMLSPGFKSMAAMAGWDEEALLLASLVVEDTPDRDCKHKKRSDLNFKTPPSNSRRKRRDQRRGVEAIPVMVIDLDDEELYSNNGVDEKKKAELHNVKNDIPKKVERDEKPEPSGSSACSSSSTLAGVEDRLREELSCAICLDICFEPSTTPCGHSFCKKCLRSAADKCGKRCPKCRQLISNGRSCTVNTVLWNTIQLLFPEEVMSRKEAVNNSREAERESPGKRSHHQSNPNNNISRRVRPQIARRADVILRSRTAATAVPSQDEDAAFALRLQREEFMEIYRGRSSLARDNLRAMAQRAINNRVRTRPV